MKAKHLRPTPRATRTTRALVVPVALVAALGATAPAMAAKSAGGKPTGGTTTTTTATCSASPDPVPWNTDYTLTVKSLAAYDIVNVLVSDSVGTRTWNLQADGTGRIDVVGHAYTSGTSNVTVQKPRNHGYATLASCSFTVT
jgi:hypothetical protein